MRSCPSRISSSDAKKGGLQTVKSKGGVSGRNSGKSIRSVGVDRSSRILDGETELVSRTLLACVKETSSSSGAVSLRDSMSIQTPRCPSVIWIGAVLTRTNNLGAWAETAEEKRVYRDCTCTSDLVSQSTVTPLSSAGLERCREHVHVQHTQRRLFAETLQGVSLRTRCAGCTSPVSGEVVVQVEDMQ